MKFGPDITKQIVDELIKLPNIRAVSAKMGIDHSTFYRWLSKHHAFNKQVTVALNMGRDRMNDAAEGVIIRGIQDNNFKAATYWLSHNSSRYSSMDQYYKLKAFNQNELDIVSEKRRNLSSSESAFEAMFELCEGAYKIFDSEGAQAHVDKFIKLVCHEDSQLEEIFYAAYAEWKKDRDDYVSKSKKAFPDENP